LEKKDYNYAITDSPPLLVIQHKCKEQNIFMSISEDVSEEDVEAPPVDESPETTNMTPPYDPPKVEQVLISLNALTVFYAP
jgi:hypothetical protein